MGSNEIAAIAAARQRNELTLVKCVAFIAEAIEAKRRWQAEGRIEVGPDGPNWFNNSLG